VTQPVWPHPPALPLVMAPNTSPPLPRRNPEACRVGCLFVDVLYAAAHILTSFGILFGPGCDGCRLRKIKCTRGPLSSTNNPTGPAIPPCKVSGPTVSSVKEIN
jgi:hypothetical protein